LHGLFRFDLGWLISYTLSDTTYGLKKGRTSWDRSLNLPH
jgi:hypothetical protein